MASSAFFLCRPLVLRVACALFLHVRGWRNVLASPLSSCHELPGRMGPIVGCAHRHSPPLSVRPAVASPSGPLWLLDVQAVNSSHAALLFRSVLRGGSCFVCPWVCPLIVSRFDKHSCGPLCRPELTLAADLRPYLERQACCSQGWLSAWSQEAGHALQAFLMSWIHR